MIDLIHPDMLKPEEVKLARCFIREPEGMRVKNKDWLKEVHKRDYRNQKYLEGTEQGKPILYGLEAEAISAKRLEDKLNDVMVPLLGKSEDLLKTYELRGVDNAIKALMIHKLT